MAVQHGKEGHPAAGQASARTPRGGCTTMRLKPARLPHALPSPPSPYTNTPGGRALVCAGVQVRHPHILVAGAAAAVLAHRHADVGGPVGAGAGARRLAYCTAGSSRGPVRGGGGAQDLAVTWWRRAGTVPRGKRAARREIRAHASSDPAVAPPVFGRLACGSGWSVASSPGCRFAEGAAWAMAQTGVDRGLPGAHRDGARGCTGCGYAASTLAACAPRLRAGAARHQRTSPFPPGIRSSCRGQVL